MTVTDRPVSGSQAVRLLLGSFLVSASAMAFGLVLGGGAPEPVPEGIPDAGAFVGWALPLSRLLLDTSLVTLIGCLLAAAFLLPNRGKALEGLSVDAVRLGSWAALVWAVSALGLYVFTASSIFGRPLSDLSGALLWQLLLDTGLGQALLLHVVLGLTAFVLLRWTLSVQVVVMWLGIVCAALLPLTFSGHSASGGSHDLAGVSLTLHLVGVSLWVGGLGALGWVAWRGSKRFEPAFVRFSHLALWAYVLVGASGVVNAVVRLGSWSELFGSDYGRIVLVKLAALVALGGFGQVQRRRLQRGGSGFGRAAMLELLLMVGVIGLSVALGRTPTPVGDVLDTPAEDLLGGPLPPAPTVLRLLWGWSPTGVGLAVVVLGTALYLRGLWTLRRRGVTWPVGRTISWVVGMLIVAWATCGGLGVYSHVMFSAHMVSHMMLSMVAPIFLVLGAPMTLALRTLPGPRQPGERSPRAMLTAFLHSRFARFMTFPLVGPLLFVGSLYGLYFSPAFEFLMSSHWGHGAMELHFLLVGTLFYYVIIGVDPAPRALPPIARFGLLLVTLPFHAFFAISIMSSNRVFASDYWTTINRPYSTNLLDDQYLGGSIAWALGEIPLLVVMIALLVQWIRSDQREARRIDRQADRDDGAALEAYNARLQELATHGKRRDPDA
ncbi:hypothetical protein ASD11_06455 [Aeromicrobium sp. Root495]|uniref:cytochrome c oxidase assembly protein n=1 Tax=Aeromicrobium sp. Root495 TaxID=1736550 RepID=UPI0006F9C7AD|nr:cytochrome c oxidase assembly protein [Aeromicrobium sp. Root495]KQY59220.1 hypothetical protein ASD11_06455 [Aeromicrobium sp. Root495]